MTIETKYSRDQEVFYLLTALRKVKSGRVNDIYIESRRGPDGIVTQTEKYTLTDGAGPMLSGELFSTKEQLLNSL